MNAKRDAMTTNDTKAPREWNDRTPPAFRDALLAMARSARVFDDDPVKKAVPPAY